MKKHIFPMFVDNAHWNRIAALTLALAEMKTFGKEYAEQVVRNAQTLATALSDYGFALGLGIINYLVIVLRKKYPDLKRPYKVPWYPWTVYAAVVCNLIFIPILLFVEPLSIMLGVSFSIIGAILYKLLQRGITIDRTIRIIEKRLTGK